MAAPRTQKKAPANAGRTTASRGSVSRASSSRSRNSSATATRSSARSNGPAKSAPASRSRKAAPARGSSRQKRRPTNHKLTTFALIGAIVVSAWYVYPVFKLQYQHQHEVRTLEAELESLKERNGELREEVDGLKTPEGVEALARETLGLVKPGEQAYVVTGGVTEESTVTVDTAESEKPMLQGVLDTLFGLD